MWIEKAPSIIALCRKPFRCGVRIRCGQTFATATTVDPVPLALLHHFRFFASWDASGIVKLREAGRRIGTKIYLGSASKVCTRERKLAT